MLRPQYRLLPEPLPGVWPKLFTQLRFNQLKIDHHQLLYEVHRNIENAFKESCIHKHRNSQRDVPWWNKLLEKLQKEACLGALRLQGVANLKSGDLTGHLKILEIFFSSPIVHLSDVQLPRREPKSGTQMAPNLKMETQELGYGGNSSVSQ
ncbi:hypothetical protein ACLKA6_000427 [Drosophila palustris]